jgi:Cytidylate kinase-like family
VGLGGGQLLKGLRGVLRLQVIAPTEIRLERVMARRRDGPRFDEVEGPLSRDRARDLIRTTDRDRNGYMRYLFRVDWPSRKTGIW